MVFDAIISAVVQTIDNMKMTDVCIGVVESVNPIKIRINHKVLIDENYLVFSETSIGKNTNEELEVVNISHQHAPAQFDNKTKHFHSSPFGNTQEEQISTTHSHAEHKIELDLKHYHKTKGLEINDKLILIRQSGGQKFFVIDKVVDYYYSD